MKYRLLNISMFYQAMFSVGLLVLSAPVFYYSIHKLYLEDIDESLAIINQEFILKQENKLTASEISYWNKFNRDVLILKDEKQVNTNEFFNQFIFDSIANELEPYRSIYYPIKINGGNYLLLARQSLVETEDLVKTIVWLFVIILATLLIGLFVINRFVSGKIWQPFYNTLHIIEKYNIENAENAEFEKTTIYEFNELNYSIEQLIKKSFQSYKIQKEFTEKAAHEMQTPVAVFQSKLDTLLQTKDLTAEQAEIVESLYKVLAKLSRLNKNLLLLAKIENNAFKTEQVVNLADEIRNILAFYNNKNIQFNTELQVPLLVNAHVGLIEILLNNLISNAINHGNEQTIISLIGNQLLIENDGTNELDKNLLFKRFSKISNLQSGNGLGLSIIKEISNKYNWGLAYSFENKKHKFSIKF